MKDYQKIKYAVVFREIDGEPSVISKDMHLEDSVQFALYLHRASNVDHFVKVYEYEEDIIFDSPAIVSFMSV